MKTWTVELTKAQIIALLYPDDKRTVARTNAEDKLWYALHYLEFGCSPK